mmetsp:Transcript_35076/g.83213  ORF Transcript_35076/g.83213 Transcript_35076/m.83213 type:complete len:724 (+) Transcript_35076:209-2380(+)
MLPKTAVTLMFVAKLWQLTTSEFLVEKGKVKYTDTDGSTKSIKMALANFGKPLYGARTRGFLVYPATTADTPHQCKLPGTDGADGVDIDCKYGCVNFEKAVPPLTSKGSSLHGIGSPENVGRGAILMLDRGPQDSRACKFTLKAWHAQIVKATAVIIVNYENQLTTMDKAEDEMTETYIKNLTIPAGFITKEDGDTLKALLSTDGKYAGFDEFKLPVTLSWEDILPRKDKVKWEFWTNSNDACGSTCDSQKSFIKDFAPVAKKLDEQDVADFEPHYLIWVCPPQYTESEQCRKQCIYNGQYCCPDPEDDMEIGYDGKDVILENLRQLCFFKMANASGTPWLWWDYVTQFGERCKMSENRYNEACADEVFQSLGGSNLKGPAGFSDGLAGLKECIGDPQSSGTNDLLEAEKEAQIGRDGVSEVSILPTIRVNGAQYRGALSTREVLRALCTGFPKDQEPDVCNNYDLTGAVNECEPGKIGDLDCRENSDGKTKCVNTFGSYYCDCDDGWVSRKQGDETICLDLNECKYLSPADLGADCECERCACHNTKGSYRCEADIPNKCSTDSPCWSDKIGGVTYSACVDLLDQYKALAVEGQADANTPLYKCECPMCFIGDGHSCKPVENFDLCDKETGSFSMMTKSGKLKAPVSGSLSVGNILVISCVVVLVATGAAYVVYRFQRRSHMDAEIRAIMAQYMPLDADKDENGHASNRATSPISEAHMRSV